MMAGARIYGRTTTVLTYSHPMRQRISRVVGIQIAHFDFLNRGHTPKIPRHANAHASSL